MQGKIQFAVGRKFLFLQFSDPYRILASDVRVPESRWELHIPEPKSFTFSRRNQVITHAGVSIESDSHSGKKLSVATFQVDGNLPGVLKIAWSGSRIGKVAWNHLTLSTEYCRGGEIFRCADLTVNLSKQTCVDGEFSLVENSNLPVDIAALISCFAWYLDENRYGD